MLRFVGSRVASSAATVASSALPSVSSNARFVRCGGMCARKVLSHNIMPVGVITRRNMSLFARLSKSFRWRREASHNIADTTTTMTMATTTTTKQLDTKNMNNNNNNKSKKKKEGEEEEEKDNKPFLASVLPKEKKASMSYARWRQVPAAVATHLCLGSVYAWSILNDPLTREIGVVGTASDDWALGSVVPVFSTILALHGISAAVVGKWQGRVGARGAGTLGALCFGGGIMLGAIGVALHSLPLLYLGYGILGGCGVGLAYVPPVASLLRWFPDRRGLATGMTIMGFGGGALLAAPLQDFMLRKFSKVPEFLGKLADVDVVVEGGKRFARVAGELKEVVVASASDLAHLPFDDISTGVYLAGTGNTGAAMSLGVLGAGYFGVMMASSLSYRSPQRCWAPKGYAPPPGCPQSGHETNTAELELAVENNVTVDQAMRTPQFWQLWTTFGAIATAGMAVVSVAKTLMSDVFHSALPLIVTGGFTSAYVMAISAANLGGRVGWASLSDRIGRKKVFSLFAIGSIPLYLVIPYCVSEVSAHASMAPLAMFYGSTLLIFSFFGANYATTPAYEADLFGSKYVGAIHGRLLTASAVASVAGPVAITAQRQAAHDTAIHELASNVDPGTFQSTFGVTLDKLGELIEAKSISISQLMAVSPHGTVDPTPFLYDATMYTAAALCAAAAVANITIKPVNPKFYEKNLPGYVPENVVGEDPKKES